MKSAQAVVLALTSLCLLFSTSLGVGIPSPSNCTVEFPMVGNHTATPMAGIGNPAVLGYLVVVRDITNAPLAGSTVTLDFSSAPSIRLYSTQGAGTTVDCMARTLSRVTNGLGQAIFAPRFGGFVNANAVEVSADAVFLAAVAARSTDINGAGGTTNVADLNLLAIELYKTPPQVQGPQTDFNNDGMTDVADVLLFRTELFNPIVGTYCP